MYRARKDWQKKNGAYGRIPYEGSYGVNGHNGVNGNPSGRNTAPTQPISPTQPKNGDEKV